MSIGKEAPIGPCALCRVVSPLIDSHIIPRWAYRRIAQDRPERPVPVAVENGVVMFQSKQLADFLLCEPCEGIVKAWDDYGAEVSYDQGRFPALEHALAHVVADPFNSPRITTTDLSLLDAGALVLFGTSVLWRAAACRKLCPTIRLGPYFEPFRSFLLSSGRQPFPNKARLVLQLLNTPETPQAQQIISKPAAGRHRTNRLFRVLLFGMSFELFVGGAAQDLQRLDLCCLARTKRAFVTDGYRHVPDLYNQAKRSTPKGAFAKHVGRS